MTACVDATTRMAGDANRPFVYPIRRPNVHKVRRLFCPVKSLNLRPLSGTVARNGASMKRRRPFLLLVSHYLS